MRVKRNFRLGSEERSEVVSKDKLFTATVLPTCKSCGTSRMSSIPMGAHAAFKVRNTLNANGERFDKQQQPSVSFTNTDAAPQPTPPARYNSKLMNSVWGMYNRYSVHNIKSHIAYDKA
ncbi:Phosphatidylinositol transfer protein sfh5 [Orchesella cincta]|uniref:Phosphatidylinositol transfer protein sfh5 n=1 Tax=Orchesella cincta TaxID=48709 RepID=A0A1D2MGJ9_ORCCI|nr:Phosphatidylinositol transfer protein sfh5 [Orchesella cincta]